MLLLANNCRCSELKVIPKNWEDKAPDITTDWYVYYRFYDPQFAEQHKKGYMKKIKGMNEFKIVKARQAATRAIIENELDWLQNRDYNPITGIIKDTFRKDYIIDPESDVCDALEAALARQQYTAATRADVKSTLAKIRKAAEQTRMANTMVKDIKRRHIIIILDQCEKNSKKFTNSTYNRYRKYLSMLFKELTQVDAIENNPVTALATRKTTTKIKVLLTEEQRKIISEHLYKNYYPFWRFMQIFYHSGARTPELLSVKKENVNLTAQSVTYTILKGKQAREVQRPIKDTVLHLWQEVVGMAAPGQHLFSKSLLPGDNTIRVDQIRHRWRRLVQLKLKIKCTWYSLKHLNTDEMSRLYGTDIAANLNKHDESMTIKHYAVNHQDRINETIKKAKNKF